MSEGTKRKSPVYTGVRKHVDDEGGYAVWVPSDWRKIDMVEGHRGWVFTPYPDTMDTCFMVEKIILDFKVTPEDKDTLVEGFEAGIQSFENAEILEKKYETGKMIVLLEARFTFTENGQRRKRWVKNLYWSEANLVLIAQGATEEEFAYWEGMLYNSMHTYEIGAA